MERLEISRDGPLQGLDRARRVQHDIRPSGIEGVFVLEA
jgi:hypothetical protein